MLGQRVWFGAGKKGGGSMLGPRIGSFVGFQTGNWMPITNLVRKKKNQFGGSDFFGGNKELAPQQKLIWQEQ